MITDIEPQLIRIPEFVIDIEQDRLKTTPELMLMVDTMAEALEIPADAYHKATDLINELHDYNEATCDHCLRVGMGAAVVADIIGADESSAFLAGMLHDIGKMDAAAVPKSLLEKSVAGKEEWTDEDREVMGRHSQAGYDMMLDRGLPLEVAEVVGAHHSNQKWHATGMELELSPEVQKIRDAVTAADYVDAMFRNDTYNDGSDEDIYAKAIKNLEHVFAGYPDGQAKVWSVLSQLLRLRSGFMSQREAEPIALAS